jgi:hypothetical protein
MSQQQRISFQVASQASRRIYDANHSAKKVADVIGGDVASYINHRDPSKRWENTCAIRMSYIFNESGLLIPRMPSATVSGKDGRQYFFRVSALKAFLKFQWGPPLAISYPPSNAVGLVGKQGVILFKVSGWIDASGHATLYDGSACYDRCYFNVAGTTYTTKAAYFWDLSS